MGVRAATAPGDLGSDQCGPGHDDLGCPTREHLHRAPALRRDVGRGPGARHHPGGRRQVRDQNGGQQPPASGHAPASRSPLAPGCTSIRLASAGRGSRAGGPCRWVKVSSEARVDPRQASSSRISDRHLPRGRREGPGAIAVRLAMAAPVAGARSEVRRARRGAGDPPSSATDPSLSRWRGLIALGRRPGDPARSRGRRRPPGRSCRRRRYACPGAPMTHLDGASGARSPRRCRRPVRSGGWTIRGRRRAGCAPLLCAGRSSGVTRGGSSSPQPARSARLRRLAPTAPADGCGPGAQQRRSACDHQRRVASLTGQGPVGNRRGRAPEPRRGRGWVRAGDGCDRAGRAPRSRCEPVRHRGSCPSPCSSSPRAQSAPGRGPMRWGDDLLRALVLL